MGCEAAVGKAQQLAEISHKEFNKKLNEMRKLGGAALLKFTVGKDKRQRGPVCRQIPWQTEENNNRRNSSRRQLSSAPLIEILGRHQSKEQLTKTPRRSIVLVYCFPTAILSVVIVGPFESLVISFRSRLVRGFTVLVSKWIGPAAKTESK